jgi:pimeloyl-ACP methyl ester carboxylesterase
MALARELGCSTFVYVSTAYTCGTVEGEVEERLHSTSGPFGNAYEASKCEAESSVVRTCTEYGLEYRILRPSIVVGLSTNGSPAGSDTGLYGLARELHRMRRTLLKHDGAIRIVGDPNTEANLVSVDFVAREMVKLHEEGLPDGPIFHLAADRGPTVKDITDTIADLIGIPQLEYVQTLAADASPLERVLAKRITFYSSYFRHSKRFVARRGSDGCVTSDELRRYVECFLAERKTDKFGMVERKITARDGVTLYVARNERSDKTQRETVVLVNALGMPHATLASLSTVLSPHFDVITWESRGVPNADEPLAPESARFERHIDDLEDVLDYFGIGRAHLLGWCTGADVALGFLARSEARVSSLGCINGAFVRIAGMQLPYQRNLERIVRRVTKSACYARLYHGLLTSTEQDASSCITFDAGMASCVSGTLACLDQSLMHLTGAPLATLDLFSRYCTLLEHYFDEAPAMVPKANVPMFFCTAEDDNIAPMAGTVTVAAQFTNSTLHIAKEGGHFAPCVSAELPRAVFRFLNELSRGGERQSRGNEQRSAING